MAMSNKFCVGMPRFFYSSEFGEKFSLLLMCLIVGDFMGVLKRNDFVDGFDVVSAGVNMGICP